ncbi:uncharacterized protein LY89DRAFT_687202 [Mollisia scopiformis]|uniref:Uncharacterized protein n=1 Tax=Mollisia scopiformis TaxID=149040 RepID=A0A194X0Z0_MOLSC|nr:uncharacterized protein LY89DRAFT_687202 [Mollisia scopiformis]KUJ13860.1 hypothetical protein LY89DRAFT_687202 [Mollisia scopiformis]
MPPITRTASPILSALARRNLQRPAFRQVRFASHVGTVSASKLGGKADWGYQWKRVGGVAMMYFPVVAVVMFWPYGVEPIMAVFEDKW